MKPISVELQAFGPYRAHTVCDFTKLYDAQLFLITGPTGGGKTTILDAMCMALYEEATGGGRGFLDMRCLSAPPDVDTQVTFTFSLDGRVYRFFRQIRIHTKRDGTLEARVTAECHRQRQDDWEPLATGSRNVTKIAESLLQFTREQFSQVIVLPQGEFRKLLLASSGDKQKLLKVLFGTDVWDRVMEAIRQRRSDLTARLATHRAQMDALLESAGVTSAPALAEALADCRTRCAAAGTWMTHTEKALTQAGEALQAGQTLARAFAQRQETLIQKKALDARRQEMTAAAGRLDTARKVAPLLQDLQRRTKAAGDLEAKRQAAAQLQTRWQQATARLEQATAAYRQVGEMEQQLETLRDRVRELMQLTRRLTALEGDRQNLARVQARLAAGQEARTRQAAALAALEQQLEDVRQQLETLRRGLEAARMRDLIASSAARLAAGLSDGAPCPVCGAVHHPAPAQPQQNGGGETEQALAACQAQENRLTQLQTHQKTAREALAALEEELRTLTLQEAQLAGQIAAAEDAADGEIALDALQAELQQKRALGVQRKERVQSIRQEFTDASSQQSAAVTALEAARQALAEAETRAEETGRAYLFALTEAGFHPETDIAPLALPPGELQALEQQLRQYETATTQTEARLAQLEETLADREPPDLEALEAAHRKAARENTQAAQNFGALQKQKSMLQGLYDQLQQLLRGREALDLEFGQVDRVYTRLQGGASKVSLHNFVLGIMLDQVVQAATRYLRTLSGERFSLVRSEDLTGRGNKGLDIDVLDGQTGGIRRAATLSGGEMFLASLSLAFGLAEVVQTAAGGVALDSIFIDEGFGTLDHSTLESVMKALARIQQEGRLVGIISHVSELSARIPAHIQVQPGENGARLTVRV